MQIYEAKDYKGFLREELESSRFGRGVRSRLAEHLKVRPSFVSLVLAGKQEFSAELGIKIAGFLGLDSEETLFFILLINHDRSQPGELKDLYGNELTKIRQKKNEIKSRVKSNTKALTQNDLQEYYGSWHHTAVHMCVRVPKYEGETTKIAQALRLEPKYVKQSLKLLERIGFIKHQGGKYVVADGRFHFGEKSPMLRNHHINWRIAAIRSLDTEADGDLHYSSISSLDRKSYEAIKKILLNVVEQSDSIIKDAKDQEVCAISFDMFRLAE